MGRDTTLAYTMGIVGHAWWFVQSPAGLAYACIVAATVGAWASTQPLIGLSALVCLVQIVTSSEFMLRSRLHLFFWQDVSVPGAHIFGSAA